MKVVQLGPYPPPHGGVQTNLTGIRRYLRERGFDCAVINITRHRKQEADQVYYPTGALALIGDLFRVHYDIVHLHIGGGIPLRVVGLALACACVPWAKSILTLHSGGYPSSDGGKTASRHSLRGFVFRRFDGLIGVNREIVEFFEQLGVPSRKTRLIAPHAVTTASIAGQLSGPLQTFFAAHKQVLLAVCLLEPEYDLMRQIEALGRIREEFSNAGLAIIGSGSLETALRAAIQGTDYAGHLLLCGDVPHDITMRAIQDCSVLLRTTLYDGDAVSVREALYLGTPVIATDNGMRPEGVELIPVGDTDALVEAVQRHLRLGIEKRPKPEADDANLEAVLQLYKSVLAKAGKGAAATL